jgi:hypothetical protein
MRMSFIAALIVLSLPPMCYPAGAAQKNVAFVDGMFDGSHGFGRGLSVAIISMDGKFGYDFFRLGTDMRIPPGAHVLGLKLKQGRGFMGGYAIGKTNVTVKLQAGVHYKAIGTVAGGVMKAWIIEKNSHHAVSSVGTTGYSLCYEYTAYSFC